MHSGGEVSTPDADSAVTTSGPANNLVYEITSSRTFDSVKTDFKQVCQHELREEVKEIVEVYVFSE